MKDIAFVAFIVFCFLMMMYPETMFVKPLSFIGRTIAKIFALFKHRHA